MPYNLFGCNQEENEENDYLYRIAVFRMEYLLLGQIRNGVRVGVGVDMFRPELESTSRSHLKFVVSAALAKKELF